MGVVFPMNANARNSKRCRVALRALPILLVMGLGGAACGMQAVSNATADEVASGPQLTSSSATSQVIAENQPISPNMTLSSDGSSALGTGGVPRLTSTSEGSRANLEGLQDISYLGDAIVSDPTNDAAVSGDGSAASPQAAPTTDDIATLVGDSFSMDVDCTLCHTKEMDNMQLEGFTGYNHKDLTCTMCHDNEAELSAAHEQYSARQATRVVALVDTAVDEELCFSCHGDRDALVAATADSTVLVDENGTQVNPHDLPAGEQHANISCGSCHKMHNDLTTRQTAQNTCLTCHHANVYECNTCHVA